MHKKFIHSRVLTALLFCTTVISTVIGSCLVFLPRYRGTHVDAAALCLTLSLFSVTLLILRHTMCAAEYIASQIEITSIDDVHYFCILFARKSTPVIFLLAFTIAEFAIYLITATPWVWIPTLVTCGLQAALCLDVANYLINCQGIILDIVLEVARKDADAYKT